MLAAGSLWEGALTALGGHWEGALTALGGRAEPQGVELESGGG